MDKLRNYLSAPVPIHTLVWLRIALGLLGGGDILGNGIYYHWYKDAFAGFTFPYYGFEWVQPLPEPFFSAFFIIGFLLGLAVATGWRFRVTAPLFALCFSYLFLLEKAHYLNHAYLFCWLAWLLALTPAWREWSLDVWRKPQAWSPVTPRWAILIFPTIMGLVYFFGGIAKMNVDWLLHADPLHSWLANRRDILVVGPLLELKIMAFIMAWGGFLLDISVAFFLLHRRLRWWALGALIFFHATNHLIFNIGIFPYLSLVLTSLWFEPDWPRKAVRWLGRRWAFVGRWQSGWQGIVHPVIAESAGTNLGKLQSSQVAGKIATSLEPPAYRGHSPFKGHYPVITGDTAFSEITFPPIHSRLLGLLALIFSLHLFLPLRHHLITGDVAWTEEGHRYSWRMMLRSKAGGGYYTVENLTTGTSEKIYPAKTLNEKQARKLFTHPDMILQYAHFLAAECAANGDECAVYANIRAKLNRGKYGPYVDPEVDLSKIQWEWTRNKSWILLEAE